MKKKQWLILFIIVIVVLALVKISQGPKTKPTASSRAKGGGKATVSVITITPQPLQEKAISSGTIIVDGDIELRCEAAGRIAEISFTEGTFVKKGQLLLRLNDADLQAQLKKAEAMLGLAQERAARQQILFDKSMISREDLETAARDLAAAQADVALLHAQIDKTRIRAPFDGIIGLREVDKGAYVAAGTKIANLVAARPLSVEFALPERFAGTVRRGSVCTFTIEGSQTVYDATITALEPKIDQSTRTITARAVCKNPDRYIVPGAFAKVEMTIRQNPAALMVPSEALVPDATGYKVYLVKDSLAVAQRVQTGVRMEHEVEIIKGLAQGDVVIVSGVLSLRPGMGVTIRKTDPAAGPQS